MSTVTASLGPSASAHGVEALRLYRLVLELQRQVGLVQLACRDHVLAAAAIGPPAPPPPAASAIDQARRPPADTSPPGPPQPVGPRSAVAVDSSKTRKRKATGNVTERTPRTVATMPAAKRQVRRLDLDAANDELAADDAARRAARFGF